MHSGVGVRLKVGDKYWEDWRGGVWGWAVPSPVGDLWACPRKKNNFAPKIMQFWASFGTSFLYYSRKWGDYPLQSRKWGTYPLVPPPAPTPMIMHVKHGVRFDDGRHLSSLWSAVGRHASAELVSDRWVSHLYTRWHNVHGRYRCLIDSSCRCLDFRLITQIKRH